MLVYLVEFYGAHLKLVHLLWPAIELALISVGALWCNESNYAEDVTVASPFLLHNKVPLHLSDNRACRVSFVLNVCTRQRHC